MRFQDIANKSLTLQKNSQCKNAVPFSLKHKHPPPPQQHN
jgi:hypothetical protein